MILAGIHGLNFNSWDIFLILCLLGITYLAPVGWLFSIPVHAYALRSPAQVRPWLVHTATLTLLLFAIPQALILISLGMPSSSSMMGKWLPVWFVNMGLAALACVNWTAYLKRTARPPDGSDAAGDSEGREE